MRFGIRFVVAASVVAVNVATASGDDVGSNVWSRRLSSERAVDRVAALRDLRRLPAEDIHVLRELANRDDVNVRTAAIDVLTQWLRGDDAPRRTAAKTALLELSQRHDRCGQLAEARLEAAGRDAERRILGEILQPENPMLVLT